MSSDPRVKKEGAPTTTTIGGAQKVSFAPRIPVRPRGAGAVGAAQTAQGQELRDLITPKQEKKAVARTSRAPLAAAAARVAFQPSVAGGAGSMSSGEEQREVALIVTHQAGAKIPGQHVAPETKREGGVGSKKKIVKKEGGGEEEVEMDTTDLTADQLAEASAEEELEAMLARENSYDQFLDNGDARQYRPILLPFPRVRLGTQGAASAARSASATPVAERPSSAFGAATSMFDIEDEAPSAAGAAARAAAASSASASAPYKALPLNTPARLLGQIDHEEKMGDSGPGARNLLFFQFPSHLPFKQSATWAPPVNPLLSLNANFRQTSMGAGTSAITFGANTNEAGHQAASGAAASGQRAHASPSLQALHALSSPALPPLQAGLGGMPNLSLGAASGGASAAGGAKKKPLSGGPMGAPMPSGLMDDVGTSSALAAEEEQDLGEVGKRDPNVLSESERLAREHKARQQRKLLLFSSNFEHAMRHLPSGQLGSLVIYKSGKIKMRIGDILLDVNEGVQCLFHQELMSIQAGTGEAFRLGPVAHRLVCTNDVEDLVRKTRERAVPHGGLNQEHA